LAQVARRVTEYDFTVLGRTPRAFDSHPRIQRDTESIVNHVFGLVSGQTWDVTAAARGLSRRAAEVRAAKPVRFRRRVGHSEKSRDSSRARMRKKGKG
jgi:hypothetical protein